MIEIEDNKIVCENSDDLNDRLYVIKRNGKRDTVKFDAISKRIERLGNDIKSNVIDPPKITIIVSQRVVPGITTTELDNLAAEAAMTLSVKHSDYEKLAARIAIDNLHKETNYSFTEIVNRLYDANEKLISNRIFDIVKANAEQLNSAIDYDRDFLFDFSGFRALEPFLFKVNGHIIERPQHLFMRVALGVCGENMDEVIDLYNLISLQYFFPTTSVLFTCTSDKPLFCESYVLTMRDDSLIGIYESLTETALISRSYGNIGFSIQCIRAFGSYIAGTNGTSNGIVPMLRVYNDSFCYVGKAGIGDDMESKMNSFKYGRMSIYIEPWHSDIFEFLELKKAGGKEELRARYLNYALWIPDIFMKRVEANEEWSLMCPKECPDLHNTYGEEFEALYLRYENEKRYRKQIKAQSLWQAIYQCQLETGFPSLLFKDTCNRLSNQKHLGVIKGGNFTCESLMFAAPDEWSLCFQGSISLTKFIDYDKKELDLAKLKEYVIKVFKYLDKMIDMSKYPSDIAANSAKKHRPIGIGVQGLSDIFKIFEMTFDSSSAKQLNKNIFETIYYGALESTVNLAIEYGRNENYDHSPLVKNGQFSFNLMNKNPSLYDWHALSEKIRQKGIRNGVLISLWPTEFSSKIFSESKSIEPYETNMQKERLIGNDFYIVNKHLRESLQKYGLWNESMRNEIIKNRGSIQNISSIPSIIREVYKTSFEIPQKAIIDMAVDRSAFIDQNQSFNVYMEEPTYAKITSMHFHAWRNGLKSSSYKLNRK